MFVKPAEGRVVPDPDKRDLLPATGRDVPATPYWHRRLADDDVVLSPPAATKTKPSPKEA